MTKQYSLFPIKHHDLWERYKLAQQQNWVAEEVDLSNDKFHLLSEVEQNMLKKILAFFAVSDGIVNDNLAASYLSTVSQQEALCYYGFQYYIECVHQEMYGKFIENYITEESEKDKLFEPIENMPTVKLKASWALKWLNSDSFEERLVAFSIVEGLMFSGLFCCIFYFKSGGKLPGLCQGNELILLDENSHYEFAVHYYKNYSYQIPKDRIREMVLEALDVEKTFASDFLIEGLPGMTVNLMHSYLEYVADTILIDYGIDPVFNNIQPFGYMSQILLDTRSNFFEKRSGSYTKLSNTKLVLDEDF